MVLDSQPSPRGMASLEDVRSWLEEGVENPERLEHVKFTIVEESAEDGRLRALRATSAEAPVMLLAIDLGDSPVPAIRVVVETGVETVDLEPERKLKLYRSLLLYSRLPLVKTYLYGDEHKLALAVDLDKKSLSRAEFNDAVASLLLAYVTIVSELGFREEAAEEAMRSLTALAAAQLRSGRGREEVEETLIAAGVPRELADRILDEVYGQEESGDKGSRLYM
ncbi:MAG: hypothetical protein LRS49_03285 [Desulfurococcales archaeon]|nr:hypothetical protein [Desulfurococcales archaeon]